MVALRAQIELARVAAEQSRAYVYLPGTSVTEPVRLGRLVWLERPVLERAMPVTHVFGCKQALWFGIWAPADRSARAYSFTMFLRVYIYLYVHTYIYHVFSTNVQPHEPFSTKTCSEISFLIF